MKENIIQAIISERDSLRKEHVEMQKSFNRSVFGFFTVGVGFSIVLFGENFRLDQSSNNVLLIAFSQILFIVSLYCSNLMVNISIHSGYIAALDEELNNIFNKRVTIWESEIAKRYIYKLGSVSVLNNIALAIVFVIIFFSIYLYTREIFHNVLLEILFMTQPVIAILFFIYAFREKAKVNQFSRDIFKKVYGEISKN